MIAWFANKPILDLTFPIGLIFLILLVLKQFGAISYKREFKILTIILLVIESVLTSVLLLNLQTRRISSWHRMSDTLQPGEESSIPCGNGIFLF